MSARGKKGTAQILKEFKSNIIKSCLEYEEFKYRPEEWDNVPEVLPRFLIYIEQFINGLSKEAASLQKLESAAHVKLELSKRTNSIIADIKETKEKDLAEKEVYS